MRKNVLKVYGDSGSFPEAKVIATEQFDNNPHKEKILQKIHLVDQGYYLNRNYKPEYPSVDIVVSKDGKK